MSIKFVTNGLHRTAGTEKVILQLSKEFTQPLTIYVPGTTSIAFHGYGNLNIISLDIGDFPNKGLIRKIHHRIKYLNAIKKVIKQNDTVFSFSFDLNTIVILLSFLRKINVIACEHIEYGYHSGIRNVIRKTLYKKKGVKVVCLTETDRFRFSQDGINAYCIPNFIYPISHVYEYNSRKILAIGRLEYQKNFSMLIEAFVVSQVYKDGWSLTIVGEGSELDTLNQLIKNYSMEVFISIKEYTKNIDEYYKSAGIFAMTSRFEAFPMVLLEAMNYRLPVLLTDFPTGAREILRDDNQQIVPNFNIQSYANQLIYLCNNTDLRINLSKKNAETVKTYHVKHIIDKWKALISNKL